MPVFHSILLWQAQVHKIRKLFFVPQWGNCGKSQLIMDSCKINNSKHLTKVFSVFVFPTQWLPIWLLCLWVLFSWYAYQLKPVLYRFPKIYVSIVGGVGGTVSYYAGYKLQVVEYGFNTSVTLIILFAEWFAMTLLILKVYGYEKLEERFNPEAD